MASWQARLRGPLSACVLLALVTVAVYWPVARHEFVNYDDPDYVTSNSRIQEGLSGTTLLWALGTGHASNWHPLTWISHALDWQIFGDRSGGHHAVNLGLHVANTLLVFLVLRLMTGRHGRSALVAALFALHPLHVESVAWVSERKDVLSTLFFLLTLGAYTHYARLVTTPAPTSKPAPNVTGKVRRGEVQPNEPATSRGFFPTWAAYCLALFFFALGLMSKPMLVTLPFLLLLLDFWPLGRIQSPPVAFAPAQKPGSEPQLSRNPAFRACAPVALKLLAEKAPFFALSLGSCVVTFLVQQKGGAVSVSLSLGARIANALVSYVRYIAKMFWPEKLSVLYPHPGTWPVGQVAACAILLLAISVAVMVLARKRPYLPVGWLWFVGGLVPVIGLIQVGVQSMADRYTYVPLIGLFIILVWAAADLFRTSRMRPQALAVIVTLAVGSCAWLTSRQLLYWRDSETLFRHAVEVTEKNYLAYNNLGFYLSNKGKVAEAIENYQRSIEINPAYEDALNNMGYALAGRKQYQAALPYYEAALRASPNHVEVHNNLGNALSELGRIDEAIEHYTVVLSRRPNHADAHNNLGIALAMQGKLGEAIPHFQDAIRFKPNYASAHSNLGNAYAVQRKLEEAIREYEESLRLKPGEAQAHNNLGNVLAELGRLDEAVTHYTRAIELNADNPEAHCNLGLALARQGKRDRAIEHFRAALKLKPDYGEAQRQLNALTSGGARSQ